MKLHSKQSYVKVGTCALIGCAVANGRHAQLRSKDAPRTACCGTKNKVTCMLHCVSQCIRTFIMENCVLLVTNNSRIFFSVEEELQSTHLSPHVSLPRARALCA